jgi:hypothetical protein
MTVRTCTVCMDLMPAARPVVLCAPCERSMLRAGALASAEALLVWCAERARWAERKRRRRGTTRKA